MFFSLGESLSVRLSGSEYISQENFINTLKKLVKTERRKSWNMVIATEKEALTKPLSFVLKKARSKSSDPDAKENLKNKGLF